MTWLAWLVGKMAQALERSLQVYGMSTERPCRHVVSLTGDRPIVGTPFAAEIACGGALALGDMDGDGRWRSL